MKLIAIHPILYQSKQYEVGQSLPANNPDMTKAWLEAQTAVWREDEEEKPIPAKATPAAAPAGVLGRTCTGNEAEETLVGKAPSKKARGIQT